MRLRDLLAVLGLAVLSMAQSCEGPPDDLPLCAQDVTCACYFPEIVSGNLKWKVRPCPAPTPEPSPTAVPSPTPSPTPTAEPTPTPSPSPSASPTPTPSPSPTASPVPSPTPTAPPTPPAADCAVDFKPVDTGWSLLGCNPACAGGNKCDCPGDGCTFTLKQGSNCRGDSTPRYAGSAPNWKTCQTPSVLRCKALPPGTCFGDPLELWPVCPEGVVERAEYPPGPNPKTGHPGYWGWNCHATTDWLATSGVKLVPEDDGFGARVSFPTKGLHKIEACRKGRPDLCTIKTAKVQ